MKVIEGGFGKPKETDPDLPLSDLFFESAKEMGVPDMVDGEFLIFTLSDEGVARVGGTANTLGDVLFLLELAKHSVMRSYIGHE